MRTKNIFKGLLVLGVLATSFTACEPNEPLIEELEVSRVFAPAGLTARVRNMTTIELNWTVRNDAAKYVVEFSEDNLQFNNIVRTIEVLPDELPVQETLEGETFYSMRVKGVSDKGLADSKWSTITAMTAPEQIFLPVEDGDIQATEATLRWPANSAVTRMVINPGGTEYVLTAAEIADGVATLSGLTGETDYTVVLYNGTKVRGTAMFTTLIDVGDATLVTPEDDLLQKIADAADGDVLVLMPGDYLTAAGSTIEFNKSITLRGLYPYDKPILHNEFSVLSGANNIALIDLELDGDGTMVNIVRFNSTATTYDSVEISGCFIHDYTRSFVSGNASNSVVTNVIIDNNIVQDVDSSGGEFIDFRGTNVLNLTITNSTFNKCATSRHFIRTDNAGLSGTGLTSTVLIDHCTLYGVANSTSYALTHVRFNANVTNVTNTIVAETVGGYSNDGNTSDPVCSDNNYFNAPSLYDTTKTKYDKSGNYTILDPGFANAASGDFTLSDQTLIDNQIGDPRWRP